MTYLPPLLRDQRKADADQLKLLVVFHYVGAGLAVLAMGFLLLHYAFMHTMLTQFAAHPPPVKSGAPPPFQPDQFFAVFKWFYLIGGGFLVVCAGINLVSARCIQLRKHRTFSLLVAGLNCLHVPLGTVLGVFTFVVLLRGSVEEVYTSGAGSTSDQTSLGPTPPS